MGSGGNGASGKEGQGPKDKPMHKCGQVGQYGTLCNNGKANTADGKRYWERDHIPAKATLFARAEKICKTMSADVFACAKTKIEYRGLAIVIPRSSHRGFSPTCGSENSPDKIDDDSASKQSMEDAKKRDTRAMQTHLNADRPECAKAYRAAAKKIKAFDQDKMIRKAVKECEAG